MHYERNYAYPLLVWLHGPKNDERQLIRVMPVISMQNFVGIAPRGTAIADDGTPGYDWCQSDEHIQQAEHRIFDSIEVAARNFHVARNKIFLAGFDTGGTMALRVALRHPRHFAGIASFCGRFPAGHSPLEHLVEARRLPLLLAVGRYSEAYPSDEVCQNLRLLHTAGMSLMLRQYPSGHELTPQMLGDLNRWIMEETCPSLDPAEADSQWSREVD